MLTTIKIVSFYQVSCLAKEILSATIRGQVFIIAIVLRNLQKNQNIVYDEANHIYVFLLWFSSSLLLLRFQNQCWRPIHCTYQMNPCTLIKICSMLYMSFLIWSKNSLCSPEFVPQIVGGALFPGVVTLKMSVWHWPFSNILLPPILVTDVVARISMI